ncbi:hypothetical protein C7N43_33105, partial [Sphingobacteriales bacterium UPWRP_1]
MNAKSSHSYLFILTIIIAEVFICNTSAIAQPAADECAGATVLAVNSSCVYSTYNNNTATNSIQAAPPCAAYAGQDVWFQFTVPPSGSFMVDMLQGTMTDSGLALYSGSCAGLTLLGCDDDSSPNGLMSMLSITGQTPGTTIYARVWDYGGGTGSFGICIQSTGSVSTPPNDNCTGATPLTVGSLVCNYGTYNNVGATLSPQPSPGCAFFNGADVWFSFTVPASGNITADMLEGTITDAGMALYSGSCSGTLTMLACDDDSSPNGLMPQISLTGLASGSTIWVRVWEFGGDIQGTFNICIQDNNPTSSCGTCSGAPPSNDACSGAYNIGTLPTPAACPTSGIGSPVTVPAAFSSNLCATAESPYTSLLGCATGGNQASPAADVWFRFTATGTDLITQITSSIPNPNFALYTGGCGTLTGLGCAAGTSGNFTHTFSPLTPGQTYYLQVSGANETQRCPFTLTLQNNKDCADCIQQSSLNVNPAPGTGAAPPGTYLPSTTVTFCYTVNQYNQTAANWLHGVVPVLGNGWNASTLVPVGSVNSCDGSGQWLWDSNGVDGTATCGGCGIVVNSPGWFYDSALGGPFDGNPENNFGDYNSGFCTWTFCWSVQTKPANQCNPTQNLNISIQTYGDSQTGSWNSPGCQNDPDYPFFANPSCCSLSATIGGGGTACTTPVLVQISFTDPNYTNGPWTLTYTFNGTPTTVTNITTNPYNINATTSGTYAIQSVSNPSCTGGGSGSVVVTITNPTASATPTNTTCGLNNGGVTLTTTGFSSPTYSWSNGATTQNLTGLAPGTYTVTVSGGGCTRTASATVSSSTLPTANATPTATTCGANNGSISLSTTGFATPTYFWSNGATTQNLTGLAPGTYTVTVSGGGCTATASATIAASTLPSASATPTHTTCGANNGSISLSTTGFAAPTYSWSNGATSQNLTGLAPGTYTVTVSGGGCTATASATIATSTLPSASATPTATTCGANNGSISLSTTGFAAPTYSWSNGATSQNLTGLAPGTYTVTASGNGCTATASATIAASTLPTATATPTSASCGLNNGSISITSTGITSPTYNWSPVIAGNPQNPSGLAPGTYAVTVSGANGCSAAASATVGNIAPPSANAGVDKTICAGQSTNLTATGGGTYLWSNGATTATISVSPASTTTYTVTVTGAGGCTASDSAIVNVNPLPSANAGVDKTICAGQSTNLTATGGGTYLWSTGATTATISASPSSTTTYTVTVTGAGGCTASDSAIVNVNPLPSANAGVDKTICAGQSTNLTATGGGTYLWSTGATTATISVSPSSTTTYTVTVTGAGGCTASDNAIVNVNPLPAANAGPDQNICSGQSVSLTASGGGTYLWSTGATTTTISVSPVSTTTYTVTVTGAGGCTASDNAVVNLSTVTANATPTSTTCGLNNGSISLTTTNFTSPTYSWSNGATTQNLTNVAAGTYTVTVTGGGCTATASATVAASSTPTATATPTATTCGLANGSISLTTANFTSPTYSWSNGATTQNITNVAAGTYTVTVTGGGCTATASATVAASPTPTATATPTATTCGLN